jgi:hypothetical protein
MRGSGRDQSAWSFTSINNASVGVAPMFSPMWLCAGIQALSPSLVSGR